MSSIAELLKQGQQILSNSETSQIDAQILLCHTLKIDRTHLYSAPEEKVADRLEQAYLEKVEQRSQGIPVAYLIGKRDFWTLSLIVSEHTLIPRPETEQLIEVALNLISNQPIQDIADLGTGTGAIALSLASEISHSHPDISIVATDISYDALLVAKENLAGLQLKNVTFKQASWYDGFDQESFDLIISNPPYIAEGHPCLSESDIQHEPQLALKSGEDGLDAIRQIIQSAPEHLNQNGCLLLEHGYDQKVAIQQLLKNRGFQKIETRQDYANLDRVTLAQWP